MSLESQVSKAFGGFFAVQELDLKVRKGTIDAVIGPYGLGKTMLINLVGGVLRPILGSLLFKGVNLNDVRTTRERHGNQPYLSEYPRLRSYDYAGQRHGGQALSDPFGSYPVDSEASVEAAEGRGGDSEEGVGDSRVVGMLSRMDLKACNLPYGEQRLLEIGQALATEPELILLDEPVADDEARRSL